MAQQVKTFTVKFGRKRRVSSPSNCSLTSRGTRARKTLSTRAKTNTKLKRDQSQSKKFGAALGTGLTALLMLGTYIPSPGQSRATTSFEKIHQYVVNSKKN